MKKYVDGLFSLVIMDCVMTKIQAINLANDIENNTRFLEHGEYSRTAKVRKVSCNQNYYVLVKKFFYGPKTETLRIFDL